MGKSRVFRIGSLRQLCLFMALVMIAALFSPIESALLPTKAYATSCKNSDDWGVGKDNGRKSLPRCINQGMYKTRRRLSTSPGCLAPPNPKWYTQDQCGQGVEYIGQSRAIRYLSDHLETPSQGLISPNVQWELQLGKNRADIVVYDRDNAAAGVDVYEAKTTENNTWENWPTQVNGYIQQLTAAGMAGVRRGKVLNRWGPYSDEFVVRGNAKDCKKADGSPGYIWRTWHATAPEDGLLKIDPVGKETCGDEDKQPENPSSPNPPLLIDVPENLPKAITTLGEGTGAAGDAAALGTPELAAAQLVAEEESFLVGTSGAAILTEAGFLTLEAALGAGGVVFTAFLLWYLIHHGGLANGDPHMTTVDGLNYDLQSAGEFTLAQSEKYGLNVQARFTPFDDVLPVSTISRLAMEVDEYRVEFASDQMLIDGAVHNLGRGKILSLGQDGYVLRDAAGDYLVLPSGVGGPVVSWQPGSGSAGLWVPPSKDSDLVGLFGNANGNPTDDLKLADGTPLPANATPAVLHSDFADSWRISDDESLFTYADGESTATFTDLTFPDTITTVHDLTPDQVRLASAQCEAAGVGPGPAFNGCVLDLALTANTDFATGAAQQENIGYDPNARGVDSNGDLSFDFEGSLPTNLAPVRASTDPSTTAFAGPFSGDDDYRFYVESLPPHLQGTLAFDLLAIGDWTAGTDTKTISVQTDRKNPSTISPQSLTPTSTGTLAGGVPYTVYRVAVPFTHADSEAEFKISASGVTGIANLAFGIDNVALHVDVVPPQTFATSLPLSISDGVPGTGAGNFENGAAEDNYTFAVSAGQSIFVDPRSCPGGTGQLEWELENAAGDEVASDYGCMGDEADNLPAGTYRLRVHTQNQTPGTYTLNVTSIPSEISATAALDGSSSTLTTTSPGQSGRWTFTGTAGQRVFLTFHDGTMDDYDAEVTVLKPDGKQLYNPQYCGNSCSFDTAVLPADGTYTVRFDPEDDAVGSLTASFLTVPADVTTTVATNGTPATLTTGIPGQNARWTFTGTTGQKVSFGLFNGTLDSYDASVSVLKPNGTVLLPWRYCGDSCNFE
ncbi:VWD domain-containing protein [Streptomyces sp. NPDC021224]|uniref:VWD domain-containing protein n=1 Tax=unclassified Streptomyces TaxID=2593676 RepID=UPI0037913A8B